MASERLWINCKNCQQPFFRSEAACPHCGASNKKKLGIIKWVGIGFAVLVGIAIIGANSSKPDNKGLQATENQARFVSIINSYKEQFLESRNEIQQRRLWEERNQALDSLLLNGSAIGWSGTVTSLETTFDGMAALSVRIAKNITLGTWNNSLSDIGDKTLISQSSPLYEKLSTIRVGDAIRFSAIFVTDTSGFRESSLTMRGAMTEPDFIVKFTEIEEQK